MYNNLYEALRNQGNLLESWQGTQRENNTIKIIRVFPYESVVANAFFSSQRKCIEGDPKSSALLAIIDQIDEKCSENHWNDNKIVIELYVGYHHIFLGLWDEQITIGSSVIPNPVYQPHCQISEYGRIKPVVVRP